MFSLLMVISAFIQNAEPVKPDLSTPRKAIEAYFTAIEAGDLQTLDEVCITRDIHKEWLRQQSAMVRSLARFGNSAVKHFGESGKSLQMASPLATIRKRLEEVEIHEDGNQAEIQLNPKAKQPLLVKRNLAGDWQVDQAGSMAGLDNVVKNGAIVFRETAASVNRLCDNIEAGKYADVDAVRTALREELQKPKFPLPKVE